MERVDCRQLLGIKELGRPHVTTALDYRVRVQNLMWDSAALPMRMEQFFSKLLRDRRALSVPA